MAIQLQFKPARAAAAFSSLRLWCFSVTSRNFFRTLGAPGVTIRHLRSPVVALAIKRSPKRLKYDTPRFAKVSAS